MKALNGFNGIFGLGKKWKERKGSKRKGVKSKIIISYFTCLRKENERKGKNKMLFCYMIV